MKRTLRYHLGIFNKSAVINLQLNIWQLNWQNEANPNDKETLINGNNVIRIYKLGGGERGEERQTELLGFIHYVTDSIKKNGETQIGSVLSNDVTVVYTCVNLKTNQLGVGC